jgi:hypothetical protein
MRRVTDPHGVAWNVDVSWTDIHVGEQYKRKRAERARARRERAEARTREDERPSRWWWLEGFFGSPDPAWGFVAVVVIIVATFVAVFAFPWLLVLFLDFAELLAFPFLAAVIVGWRVTRRRPFTITAEHGGELVAEWSVVGWREARRVERAVADAIVAGGEPLELFPDYSLHH